METTASSSDCFSDEAIKIWCTGPVPRFISTLQVEAQLRFARGQASDEASYQQEGVGSTRGSLRSLHSSKQSLRSLRSGGRQSPGIPREGGQASGGSGRYRSYLVSSIAAVNRFTVRARVGAGARPSRPGLGVTIDTREGGIYIVFSVLEFESWDFNRLWDS